MYYTYVRDATMAFIADGILIADARADYSRKKKHSRLRNHRARAHTRKHHNYIHRTYTNRKRFGRQSSAMYQKKRTSCLTERQSKTISANRIRVCSIMESARLSRRDGRRRGASRNYGIPRCGMLTARSVDRLRRKRH